MSHSQLHLASSFSNDFLSILEVTGEEPYPEFVLPVSLVCTHLKSFSGALEELNE